MHFCYCNRPELAATISSPISGRILDVLTQSPGLQFYTGGQLNGSEWCCDQAEHAAAAAIPVMFRQTSAELEYQLTCYRHFTHVLATRLQIGRWLLYVTCLVACRHVCQLG